MSRVTGALPATSGGWGLPQGTQFILASSPPHCAVASPGALIKLLRSGPCLPHGQLNRNPQGGEGGPLPLQLREGRRGGLGPACRRG